MDSRWKIIISNWLDDKKISFKEDDLIFFSRKSFKRFKHICKESERFISISGLSFQDINNIWKANIIFARLIFKYVLFFENFLEASLEQLINSPNIAERFDNYFLEMTIKIKDIKSHTPQENRKKLIDRINNESTIVQNFNVNKDFTNIKFYSKCIIYKCLINKNDSFKLPINNINKIRTLRNRAVHHEFLINFFIEDNNTSITLLKAVIDESHKKEFDKEVINIVDKYNIKKIFDL